jgi:hypothetical protein
MALPFSLWQPIVDVQSLPEPLRPPEASGRRLLKTLLDFHPFSKHDPRGNFQRFCERHDRLLLNGIEAMANRFIDQKMKVAPR